MSVELIITIIGSVIGWGTTIVVVTSRFIKLETLFEVNKLQTEKDISVFAESCKTVNTLETKISLLEERIKEDREKNTSQHDDFYAHRLSSEQWQAEQGQQLNSIASTLERVLNKLDDMDRQRQLSSRN